MSAVAEIIDKMKTLTALELVELKKGIEETFDVTAAAAAPVMMAAMPGAAPAAEVEEKTEFDAVLEEYPADKKIAILKVVREITGLGLKEAKELVEAAPKAIKEGIAKDAAEEIKKKLEAEGAKVSVK